MQLERGAIEQGGAEWVEIGVRWLDEVMYSGVTKEHSPCSLHFVPAAVANLTVSFNVCVPSVRSNETIAGFDWWSDRAESRVSPSLVVLANIFWDSQLRNLGIGQKYGHLLDCTRNNHLENYQ